MKFNDISDKLNTIRAVCKSTLFCQEYEKLGLDQTECCNKASDMAAELWGFSKKDCRLSAGWHEYDFSDYTEIEINANGTSGRNFIRIARSPLYYAVSFSFSFKYSGCDFPISIWNVEQFFNKDSAIEFGFDTFNILCDKFCSEPDRSVVKYLIKASLILKEKYCPVQMSFDLF
ncbi:MAG: hypothetical protein GX640_17240 [Fibrobacter sp.]|mgnify:CR=1 FL=1|nr:hypothetical protein [Fibrobacter sp.]